MVTERRSKPRPVLDSSHTAMSNAELDAAIRELNRKVAALMAERRSRHGQESMQSASLQESEQPPSSHTP